MSRSTPTYIGTQPFYDVLKERIADDFCRHVDPIHLNTLLKHRRVLLTEAEEDELKAVESSRGRWKACEFLLNCLATKKKWFKYLIIVLENPSSNLVFLAGRFANEKAKLMEACHSDESTYRNIPPSMDPELPICCESSVFSVTEPRVPSPIDKSQTEVTKVVYTRL